MLKAWSVLKQDSRVSKAFKIPCDSHGIQLVFLKVILGLGSIKEVFEPTAKIIEYFKHSPKQYSFLRGHQESNYGRHYALIGSVITRWGSTFRMVKSLPRFQKALRDWGRKTGEKTAIMDVLMDMMFWDKLEQLAKILAVIDEPLRMSESQSSSVVKVNLASFQLCYQE